MYAAVRVLTHHLITDHSVGMHMQPVCTTEIGRLALKYKELSEMGVKLATLSCDPVRFSMFLHAWPPQNSRIVTFVHKGGPQAGLVL